MVHQACRISGVPRENEEWTKTIAEHVASGAKELPRQVTTIYERWMAAPFASLSSMSKLYQSRMDWASDSAEMFYQRTAQIMNTRPADAETESNVSWSSLRRLVRRIEVMQQEQPGVPIWNLLEQEGAPEDLCDAVESMIERSSRCSSRGSSLNAEPPAEGDAVAAALTILVQKCGWLSRMEIERRLWSQILGVLSMAH